MFLESTTTTSRFSFCRDIRPHWIHERNVLTREPPSPSPSVFLHLFLPTPGPNHNHQDGRLQTCNSLYFCRQPNLPSTQARHDQELFRPPAPFPLMKMAIHLSKSRRPSPFAREWLNSSKTVNPGTSSQTPLRLAQRQTFVVQINPRRVSRRDRGQVPKSAPYLRHHHQATTRDRLSSTASP